MSLYDPPLSGIVATLVILPGLLSGATGFVVLGAVVLAEELYETAVVASIIRHGAGTG